MVLNSLVVLSSETRKSGKWPFRFMLNHGRAVSPEEEREREAESPGKYSGRGPSRPLPLSFPLAPSCRSLPIRPLKNIYFEATAAARPSPPPLCRPTDLLAAMGNNVNEEEERERGREGEREGEGERPSRNVTRSPPSSLLPRRGGSGGGSRGESHTKSHTPCGAVRYSGSRKRGRGAS